MLEKTEKLIKEQINKVTKKEAGSVVRNFKEIFNSENGNKVIKDIVLHMEIEDNTYQYSVNEVFNNLDEKIKITEARKINETKEVLDTYKEILNKAKIIKDNKDRIKRFEKFELVIKYKNGEELRRDILKEVNFTINWVNGDIENYELADKVLQVFEKYEDIDARYSATGTFSIHQDYDNYVRIRFTGTYRKDEIRGGFECSVTSTHVGLDGIEKYQEQFETAKNILKDIKKIDERLV